MVCMFPVNHVALSVRDINRAIEFYKNVFGLELISLYEIKANEGHSGKVCSDLFPGFKSVKIAHLRSANGVGIELFEFEGAEKSVTEYWKTGIIHVSITVPDIEETLEKIEKFGGRIKSKVWEIYPGSGCRLVYTEDPDGNIIELNNKSYEATHCNRQR